MIRKKQRVIDDVSERRCKGEHSVVYPSVDWNEHVDDVIK